MTDAIKDLIINLFGDMAWLGIIIIAMIPIIELRGAIPFALSEAWGALGLEWPMAYLFSVVGATIPALIIIPLLIPVFNWLGKNKFFKKIVNFFDENFTKKSKKIAEKLSDEDSNKKMELKKFWGVVAFVAVPLPLTGAWTGSAVAAYLKLGYLKGCFAVFLGNIISGAIMTSLCLIFPNSVDLILNIFLALVVVVLIAGIIGFIIKRYKNNKKAVSVE